MGKIYVRYLIKGYGYKVVSAKTLAAAMSKVPSNAGLIAECSAEMAASVTRSIKKKRLDKKRAKTKRAKERRKNKKR